MKKAFTLIELLVVVLIIGILSAIALPQYTAAVEKSRLAEALVNIKAIQQAHTLDRLTNGTNSKPQDIVELSGGSWNTHGWVYCTKNFLYEMGEPTELEVFRCVPNSSCSACQASSTLYGLDLRTAWTGEDDIWENRCDFHSDIGKKMCNSIKGQGIISIVNEAE